jgi:hypothetical protein
MSYKAIDQLTMDVWFQARTRACCTQEAQNFRNDARPNFVALADDLLRGGGATTLTFVRLGAASPGVAESATDADGNIDSSKVTDEEILAFVQPAWELVSLLFWDKDGSPLPPGIAGAPGAGVGVGPR